MPDQAGKVLRSNSLNRTSVNQLVTINFLKQKKIKGETLSSNELNALNNFETYSQTILNNASEAEYDKKFMEISALSNLTPYEEFLKEKYTTK